MICFVGPDTDFSKEVRFSVPIDSCLLCCAMPEDSFVRSVTLGESPCRTLISKATARSMDVTNDACAMTFAMNDSAESDLSKPIVLVGTFPPSTA